LKSRIGKFLGELPERVERKNFASPEIYEAVGCEKCGGLGYKGRVSIFELLRVDEAMETAIYGNPTEIGLKNLAEKQGMVTMQDDGILKTLIGTTSFDEVERLTGEIPWLRG